MDLKNTRLPGSLRTFKDDIDITMNEMDNKERDLQVDIDTARSRGAFTALYMAIFLCCFILPILHYFRMKRDRQRAARRRTGEDEPTYDDTRRGFLLFQGMTGETYAIRFNQTEVDNHNAEHLRMRQKYLEEKRLQFRQLMAPQRMILKADNFPPRCQSSHSSPPLHDKEESDFEKGIGEKVNPNSIETSNTYNDKNETDSVTTATEGSVTGSPEDDISSSSTIDIDGPHEEVSNPNPKDMEMEATKLKKSESSKEQLQQSDFDRGNDSSLDFSESPYGDDDESMMIEIPVPGFSFPQHSPHFQTVSKKRDLDITEKLDECELKSDADDKDESIAVDVELALGRELFDRNSTISNSKIPKRLVPGMCMICLSSYKVGSDVVWSSNPECEHVFHHDCIERWLVKQSEGPLCPCCRRDFLIDPFETYFENINNEENSEQQAENEDSAVDDIDLELPPSRTTQQATNCNSEICLPALTVTSTFRTEDTLESRSCDEVTAQ